MHRRANAESSMDEAYGFVIFGSNGIIVYRPGKIVRDDHTRISVTVFDDH